MRTALDPDCVKTCTEQKPLESYSNTPTNHPLLEHSNTKARRESPAPEEEELRSFRDFCASASLGAKMRASREKERTSDAGERHSTAPQHACVFTRPRPTAETHSEERNAR